MMRTPAQYLQTYNINADKYLRNNVVYIDNMQKGQYLINGGILSLLFNYAQASIDLEITDTKISNNVLDKIIVMQ
jgi:hypothetical protein